MYAPISRLLTTTAFALALTLVACGGGGQSAKPTAISVLAAEAPTRTPRPTREPTAAPTAEPTGEPTAAPAASEILPVEFGDLQTYVHPSGVFTIDIPENWDLQDNSRPDEVIIVWTDPTRNGGVIVDLFEDETSYTDEQLTDILNTFLENSFGGEPDFSVDEPVTQNDGSILLAWSYTATADNDTPVKLSGNSFIEQRENKVSILTTLVPSEQFETTVERTDEIINTYTINPGAVLSASAGSESGTTLGGADATGALPATIVAIGETVDVGSGLMMTITGVEEPAGDEFRKPDEGNKYLIVQAIFENAGSTSQPVSTLLQMSLLDATGAQYELDILATSLAERPADGEVPAGGRLEGSVGFQIPADATNLVFVFDPLIDGETVGVALE